MNKLVDNFTKTHTWKAYAAGVKRCRLPPSEICWWNITSSMILVICIPFLEILSVNDWWWPKPDQSLTILSFKNKWMFKCFKLYHICSFVSLNPTCVQFQILIKYGRCFCRFVQYVLFYKYWIILLIVNLAKTRILDWQVCKKKW